jgi:hypothetical protein
MPGSSTSPTNFLSISHHSRVTMYAAQFQILACSNAQIFITYRFHNTFSSTPNEEQVKVVAIVPYVQYHENICDCVNTEI